MNFYVQINLTICFLQLADSPDIVLHFPLVWSRCPQTWIFYEFFSSIKVRKAHFLSIILSLLYKAIAQLILILISPFFQGAFSEGFPFLTFNRNVSHLKLTHTKPPLNLEFPFFFTTCRFSNTGSHNNGLKIFLIQILQPSQGSNPSIQSWLLITKPHPVMIYFAFIDVYTKSQPAHVFSGTTQVFIGWVHTFLPPLFLLFGTLETLGTSNRIIRTCS